MLLVFIVVQLYFLDKERNTMVVKIKIIIIIIYLCLSFGYSSITTLNIGIETDDFICDNRSTIPRIYSGIFNDIRFMSDENYNSEYLFFLTDFPFSFIVDTVVLPYTITTQVMYGNICN